MYHLKHGELTMTQNVIMMLFLKVSNFTSDVIFLNSLNSFRCWNWYPTTAYGTLL